MPRISEIKKIKYHPGGFCNPVCIGWLNSLGGWDRWVFEVSQAEDVKVKKGDLYFDPFDDLETEALHYERTKGAEMREKVTVRATNLELQEVRAIREIGGSPQVYEYKTDASGNWQKHTIRITRQQTGVETRHPLNDITITFERQKTFFIDN